MYPTRRACAEQVGALGWLCACACIVLVVGCGFRSAESLYDMAVAKAKQGDITGSMIDLKNALQKRSDFGPARQLLGEHYLRMGDPLSALKELERAQKLGQTETLVLPKILRAKLDAGQSDAALKTLSKISDARLDAQLWALRGEALMNSGDSQGAAKAIAASLARDPNNADAHLNAALLAWAGNNLTVASREFAAAVKLAPDGVRGWLAKGDFDLTAGRGDDAVAAFNVALQKSFGFDKAKARIGLARCGLLARDFDGADRQLKAVLHQAPNNPMAHYLAGYLEFQRHNWDVAEDHLQQVLSRAPDHLPSLLLKGVVNLEQKKYLQGEAALTRVVALAPSNLQARKALANLYMRQGEAAKAVAVLDVPSAEAGADLQYQSLLGGALMRNGQPDKAVATLQKAGTLAPETAEVRTQLALSKLAAGDDAGAIADLRAISGAKEGGARAEQLLVLVLLQRSKFDEVLVETERLKRLNPKEPTNYNFAAAAWLGKHDATKAAAELRTALQLDPKFSPAKVNLAKLFAAQKDFDKAMRLFNEARADSPQSIDPVMGLAAMEFQRKNDKVATELLEGARKKWADAVEPRLILAQLYFGRGQYAQAEVPAQEAVRLQPSNVAASSLYGKVLFAQRKIGPALDVLERIAPKAMDDPGLQYDLAVARAAVGDTQGASEASARAVNNSQHKNIPALFLDARLALEQKRIEDARKTIALLKTSLGKNPTPAAQASWLTLNGDLARVQSQWPAALAAYSQAFALVPSGETLGRVTLALNASGRNAEAVDKLVGWLKTHPNDVEARFRLADIHMAAGHDAQAKASYEALVAAKSDNAVVNNNLAWLYLKENDTKRGLASAEKAYAAATENPDVMDTVAWLRFKSGKTEGVRALLERAAAKSKSPEVRYHLAEVMAADGDAAEARAELDALIKEKAEFPSKSAALALRNRL